MGPETKRIKLLEKRRYIERKIIRRGKTDAGVSFPLLYIIKRLYPVFYEYVLVKV